MMVNASREKAIKDWDKKYNKVQHLLEKATDKATKESLWSDEVLLEMEADERFYHRHSCWEEDSW